MPKVLVAVADADKRLALQQELQAAGYEVSVAPSGSFALTMLEWDRPDVILSAAKVDDMDGYELFTLVRRDPLTKDTPFILLAGRDRPIALAAAETGVDVTVTGDFTVAMVVSRVSELMRHGRAPEPARQRPGSTAGAPPATRAAAAAPPAAPPTVPVIAAAPAPGSFQGSLGAMDLPELTQVISLGGKTGQLSIGLSSGEGMITFERGRVVHAVFAGRTGEAAFGALVLASQRETEARFCFNRAEGEALAALPRTISRSVAQLLLDVAKEIDEATQGAAGRSETAAPRRPRREG